MTLPPRPRGVAPTPRLPGLSLEWKIPLLMTAVLALGLAGMLVVTYGTLRRRAEFVVRDRLTHAVREVAASTGPGLTQRTAVLREVAREEAVRRALALRPVRLDDLHAAVDLLDGMRSARDTAFTAELWDARGRVVALVGTRLAAEDRPGQPPPAAPDEPWYSPILPGEDRARFWIAVPVHGGSGERIGWVALLRTVGGPADATRMLREFTREDLTLFIRNADGSGWVLAPGTPAQAPARRDSQRVGLWHVRGNGERFVAAEASVEGTPWVITLEVPLRSVLAPPRTAIGLLALLSVGLLFAGAGLSWWIGRQITRPISALTHAAAEVARGTYHGAVDAGGDEIGRLAASFDAMARQVEGSRRGLEQRAEEAQAAREAAEEANRVKTQFLSAMSHELRTPLNAIGGYAQLLEMGLHGEMTAQQRGALARIQHSQAHLLALIEDLLGFAQLEAGRVRYTLEEVPLADTVAELEGLVEPQAAARRVRVGFAAAGAEVRARGDRDKVRQVALNLVVNAIKFTPEGGEVAVECHAEADHVQLRVRDTGVGIPAEHLERIFEPFVQGEHSSQRAAEGVGLGLAISRELARGMGGEVSVASVPGIGSTFTLTLPRAGDPSRA